MVSLLVDSSVALRLIDMLDPKHSATRKAIRGAEVQEVSFHLVTQVIAESWSVLTRPNAVNGIGLNPASAKREIEGLMNSFPMLADPANVGTLLPEFALRYQVSGRQIHDARLALTTELLSLDGIVTYNKSDFVRYTSIRALEPSELSSLSA